MAIHSSIFAWRIPWTEEAGGLLSMGFKESDATEHSCVQVKTRSLNAYHFQHHKCPHWLANSSNEVN